MAISCRSDSEEEVVVFNGRKNHMQSALRASRRTSATPSLAYTHAFFAGEPPVGDLSSTVVDASDPSCVDIIRVCFPRRAAVELSRRPEEARGAHGMLRATEEVSREKDEVHENGVVDKGIQKLGSGLRSFCGVM